MALTNCYKRTIFGDALRLSDLGSSYAGPYTWMVIPCITSMNAYNTAENASERVGPYLKFGPFPRLGSANVYIGSWIYYVVEAIQAGNNTAFTADLAFSRFSTADSTWTTATAFASKPVVTATGINWSWSYTDLTANNIVYASADAATTQSAGVAYHYAQAGWDDMTALTFVDWKLETPTAWVDESPEIREYTNVAPNKFDKTAFYARSHAFGPKMLIAVKRAL